MRSYIFRNYVLAIIACFLSSVTIADAQYGDNNSRLDLNEYNDVQMNRELPTIVKDNKDNKDYLNFEFLRTFIDRKKSELGIYDEKLKTLRQANPYFNNIGVITAKLKRDLEDIVKQNRNADSVPINRIKQDVEYKLRQLDLFYVEPNSTINTRLVFEGLKEINDQANKYPETKKRYEVSVTSINQDINEAGRMLQKMYDVEKGNQDFKSRISLYFTGIIVLLLIGFFVFITIKASGDVASMFLNGNGLQFIALFSLIISVILFGILGVLEGRELAAILSGISGFILGKGISSPTRSGTQDPSADPPNDPPPPRVPGNSNVIDPAKDDVIVKNEGPKKETDIVKG